MASPFSSYNHNLETSHHHYIKFFPPLIHLKPSNKSLSENILLSLLNLHWQGTATKIKSGSRIMGMQSSSLSTISHWSYCYQQLDLTTFWTCQVARGQLHTCQEPLITGCKFFFRFKTNLIYNTFSGLSLINFHSSKPSKIHSDF